MRKDKRCKMKSEENTRGKEEEKKIRTQPRAPFRVTERQKTQDKNRVKIGQVVESRQVKKEKQVLNLKREIRGRGGRGGNEKRRMRGESDQGKGEKIKE